MTDWRQAPHRIVHWYLPQPTCLPHQALPWPQMIPWQQGWAEVQVNVAAR